MGKKQMPSGLSSNWNAAEKEPWHLEFDEEPVNDERWTCIVTAVIPAKPEDEECIEIFRQCAASGLRRAVKVITMADVVSLLMGKNKSEKGSAGRKSMPEKRENASKSETNKKKLRPPGPRDSPIVNLVGRYASYAADGECKLPPDLMAAILKYVILNMKDENVFEKKVKAVSERKLRERDLRLRFVKSMKPFKASEETQVKNRFPNARSEPLNDEPRLGPDLYLVLIDFYDPFYFHELYKINVPFVAILKITNFKGAVGRKGSHTALAGKPEQAAKKEALISNFWTVLADNCSSLENTTQFKDFLLMQYQPEFSKAMESKQQMRDTIFDEMSSMLYTVFSICRQHQTYLSELRVQEVCLSLEPLDLSKCTIYNKLCDALITGEPNSVLLVLYSMIEQVVVGVPHTENVLLKYEPRPSEYFSVRADSSTIPRPGKKNCQIGDQEVVTPCFACREKKAEPKSVCKEPSAAPNNGREAQILFRKSYEDDAGETTVAQEGGATTDEDSSGEGAHEFGLPESVLDEFLSGQASGVPGKSKESWKSPVFCLYGDKLTLHNYHCDSRLIDSESVVSRFLQRTSVPQLWAKYPVLPPGKKAFYEYHFFRLMQLTNDSRDLLRIKFFFLHAMKLMGISSAYLYKGEEETLSELIRTGSREKTRRWSKVKFDRYGDTRLEPLVGKNFSACVFRPYVKSAQKKVSVKAAKVRAAEKQEKSRASFLRADSSTLRKAVSLFNVSLATHRNSGYCFSYFFKLPEGSSKSSPMNPIQFDKEFAALLSLLDCYDISNLSESHLLNSEEDYINLVKNFNFYECLEPRRMVQTLLEAQENFSTTQCSYFAPTDTLVVLLHNDSDHRGVLFTAGYGTLSTPVSLRDFYSHVYLELGEWLQTEKSDYAKFIADVEEKDAKDVEKSRKDYVTKLKKKFRAMSANERAVFLSSEPSGEVEVTEDELRDLPVKAKPERPNRVSYLATDFTELRIETERKVKEFHSRDGTEINVLVDSWLYSPSRLLTLKIAKSQLRFLYHQCLGEDFETTFLLRTESDVNFVFWKDADDETEPMFRMKLSLPTGLVIRKSDDKFGPFIKQYYLNVYKKWWKLEDEKCRYFLTSGQVVIFHEDGRVEVLCASGTRHVLKDFTGDTGSSADGCLIRTTTSTGDVWERSKSGRCRNKRKLVDSVKLFVGVDPKTQETYYRRDDGVSSMLWPNGKLITHFSDGTKITSTPEFEPNEISVEWTQEEKLFIQQIVSSYREEAAESRPKSKTILKRPSPDSLPVNSRCSSEAASRSLDDGFVSITVSYLIEHPKYSTVCSELQKPQVKVTMPGHLSVKVLPDGTYLLNQDQHYLNVQKDSVAFYTVCAKCDARSTASIYFDTDDVLCKFVDFFGAVFYVYRNGETAFLEREENETSDNAFVSSSRRDECQERVKLARSCPQSEHMKSMSSSQRCFVLERDLSGIELIHNETLARHCYNLPEDTFYELHAKGGSDSVLTHVFSSPHWKAGFEEWIMDYEEKDNSLPTNLKRRDLKEMGARDNVQNLFKYPFSRHQTGGRFLPSTTASHIQEPPKLPKIVVTRIVKCVSQNPSEMISELKEYIAGYQAQAHGIIDDFKKRKTFGDGHSAELEDVKNKLEQLALSFKEMVKPEGLYKHMSTVVPSTDFDIHNSAHHIHKMNELSSFNLDVLKNWVLCPQLPLPISTLGGLKPVHEDADYSDED